MQKDIRSNNLLYILVEHKGVTTSKGLFGIILHSYQYASVRSKSHKHYRRAKKLLLVCVVACPKKVHKLTQSFYTITTDNSCHAIITKRKKNCKMRRSRIRNRQRNNI